MQTKIWAVVYVVLAAFLLVASAPVARADEQPATKADSQIDRDFYQCLKLDDMKTCMLERGYSDEETTDLLRSPPDQELYAPYTGGDRGRSDNGAESGGI
jgi:hypothetical protein